MKKTVPFCVYLIVTSCASTSKPPACVDSANLSRVNPPWVSEMADYSIPWDNHRDMNTERLNTIREINNNKHKTKKHINTKKQPKKSKNRKKSNATTTKYRPEKENIVFDESRTKTNKAGRKTNMKAGIAKKDEAWFIHMASYKNIAFAERHESKLLKAKYPAYVRTVNIDDTTYHRVLIGPELRLETAEEMKKEIDGKYNSDGMIYSNRTYFKH